MARTPGGTLSAFTLLSTPDAPTITSISTSIGSASVAFTAPTDTGDGAISSYVVTAVDESSGASTGGTGASSPITVSPPAGGTFKIRMQALNPYGPGRLTEYDTGNVIYGGAELYAWGSNGSGELGDDTTVRKSSPIQVGSLTNWFQISVGNKSSTGHTVAVKTDGTLWAWGSNEYGRLGLNISYLAFRSSPVQVGALTTWSQVVAGGEFTAAIKTDGTLWTWGNNSSGQLGDGTVLRKSSPIQVGALTDWAQIAAGRYNIAAIKTNNTLWAWGSNLDGQLGDGTKIRRSSPVQIGALTNWSQIAVGYKHTAATKTDGTMWAWGYNANGEVGSGTTIYPSSPVQIGALTNWSQVAAGKNHTTSIKTDGTLWSWGNNEFGQLGDGTVVRRSSPVQIGALTTWSQIAGVGQQTAAIKSDGTLWTWGLGSLGELGTGNTIRRSSPVQVGALTTWFRVARGPMSDHTVALLGVV